MKQALTLLCAIISLQASATNYYFSISGSDAAAGTIGAPWASISKMQTTLLAAANGDSILLKRGDIWYGQFRLQSFAGNVRVMGAYGTGAKPVISGFTILASWSSLGGNKYEAPMPNNRPTCGVVTIDGKYTPVGRYPNRDAANGGYLTYSGGLGSTQFYTSLTGSPSYVGKTVVVRKNRFILDKGPVTFQSAGTITFSPGEGSGWGFDGTGTGFFFQNDYGYLDADGEWYYNNSPARLDLYSTVNPSGRVVKAAIVDTLVYIYAQNNLTISNIRFEGSNMETLRMNNDNTCTIKNCEFAYNGLDGARIFACTQFNWFDNLIEYSGNNSVYFEAAESTTLKGSTFRCSGIWEGMGKSNGLSHLGFIMGGNSTGGILVENCVVDSVGYNGIHFAGNNQTFRYNAVSNFNLKLDDGGGIYSSYAGYSEVNRIVRGNIVTNGRGYRYGTNIPDRDAASNGIYMDDRSSGVTIDSNTVANCSEVGLYLHNSHEDYLLANTVYNCAQGVRFNHDNMAPSDPIKNVVFKNNVIFAKVYNQEVFHYYSIANDFSTLGTMDSNFYCRPSAEATNMIYVDQLSTSNAYNFTGWRNSTPHDVFSRQTPSGYVSSDSVLLVTNPATNPAAVPLGQLGYLNMRGAGYTGTITVPPFQSRLIIRKNLEAAILPGRRIIVQQ